MAWFTFADEGDEQLEERKIKVLLTKSALDAHDRGVRYVARKLTEAGMEVVFTRYVLAEEVVNSALQEDVDVIGVSFSTGGQVVTMSDIRGLLREREADNILLVVGGIIPEDDIPRLKEVGVEGIFGPGTAAQEMIDHVLEWIKV